MTDLTDFEFVSHIISIVHHGTSTSTVFPHRPSTESLAATSISPMPVEISKVIDLVKGCSSTCGWVSSRIPMVPPSGVRITMASAYLSQPVSADRTVADTVYLPSRGVMVASMTSAHSPESGGGAAPEQAPSASATSKALMAS